MAPANEVRDGFLSLAGGMNGGFDISLLEQNTYAKGINLTCRDGIIKTRPSFSVFAELAAGNFQGAHRW